MNNIKPYCQFVHRQLTFVRQCLPLPVPGPIKGNAIILLTFMKDDTLLADIFTLTQVEEEAHLTRLTATNRKGHTVQGTWVEGRYAWQNNIKDLHSWVAHQLRRRYCLSFLYQCRYLRLVMQCVKDQIPLCNELLPEGCAYIDVVRWARPIKRIGSMSAIGLQIGLIPLLFILDNPLYFLILSFILMGVYHLCFKQETEHYLDKGGLINHDIWDHWLTHSRQVMEKQDSAALDSFRLAMDALFKNTIENTSPGYSLLMQTRHRMMTEALDELLLYPDFPHAKYIQLRLRIAMFITEP